MIWWAEKNTRNETNFHLDVLHPKYVVFPTLLTTIYSKHKTSSGKHRSEYASTSTESDEEFDSKGISHPYRFP